MRQFGRKWGRVWLCTLLGSGIGALANPAEGADKNGISAQTISLPSGPGSIEGLGESFEPQLNTGTATFAVPFVLQPGRSGITPRLGLGYNGGGGNGIAGVGWSLDGLDSIQRQTDKGIPLYNETADHPGTDTFVSAGGEELVLLDDGTFRAENESEFRRYRFDSALNTWIAEAPDGTETTYGAVASARVESVDRTARWLATRVEDSNGNRVEFEYTTFADSPNQVYLSRIVYGGHATQSPLGRHIVRLGYEGSTRPDPISDFRFGFEVGTGRRLIRVDMCTSGGSFTPITGCDDVGEVGAARIRTYRLGYDEVGACESDVCIRGLLGNACNADTDCTSGVTRLQRVTQTGEDDLTALRPLSLSYTELSIFDNLQWTAVANFPQNVVSGPDGALVDLNSDALPDVVESPPGLPGTLRRYLNQGPAANGLVSFALPEAFAGPVQRLSTPGTQIADLDGDGDADFLSRPAPDSAEFDLRRGSDAGFFGNVPATFGIQGLDGFSAQGFDDPRVQFTDLDFDKRIDIVRSDTDGSGNPTGLRVRINRREGSQEFLDQPVTCGALPGVDFANGKTFFADLNGDRLLDVVRVSTSQNGVDEIRYFPACGRGAYGRGASCAAQGESILVGGAPVQGLSGADFQNFRGFHWQDLTNDGLADLLWTGPLSMTAWINTGGERLRRVELGAYVAGVDFDRCDPGTGCNPVDFDRILFADVNGNGTTDVLHVDRETLTTRYLDVVGPLGVPPNLLKTIDNGLGQVVTIGYESSTADYLDALATAKPWRTRAPFPVTVVSSRTVRFGLDLDAVPGEDEYRTEFRYRDPFYDAVEKEFRGFAEVEVLIRGEANHPTLVRRHHFHTGAPDGVDNDGDGEIDERTLLGGAEAEPLKGVLLELRQESCSNGPDGDCGETGEAFVHDLNRFEIQTLYGATGRRCSENSAVGCCSDDDCAAAGGTCEADGSAESALFDQESCVAGKSVEQAIQTGTRTAFIERGIAPRIDTFVESDYDGYGHVVEQRGWGVVDMPDLPGFGCILATGLCSLNSNALCGSDSDCAPFGFGTCEKRSVADNVICAGDAFAFTNPALPDDERFETSEFIIDEASWMLSCQSGSRVEDEANNVETHARTFFDELPLGECSRGNPTRQEVEFVEEARFVPVARQTFDAFGNAVETQDANGNRLSFAFDPAFHTFSQQETIHLDGYDLVTTAQHHEGFGTVTAATTFATSGLGPAFAFEYDALGRLVASIAPGDSSAFPTRRFEYQLNPADDGVSAVVTRERETAGGGTIDSFSYVDALGRPLGTKEEGDDGQWIFVAPKGYHRTGSESRTWHAYATGAPDYEAPDPSLPFRNIGYDALGRITRTTVPDGNFAETRYVPLGLDGFDENDTAGVTPGAFRSLRQDGLNRLTELTERGNGNSDVTAYTYDARGNLTSIRDAMGNLTTARFDSLGRLLERVGPDRGSNRFVYDDVGNAIESTDALGRKRAFAYDAANRLATENDLDTTGDPSTDPVDVEYRYDFPPAAPIALDDGTQVTPTFTAGLLVSVIDRSGEQHTSFDARRRPIAEIKRVRHPVLETEITYPAFIDYDAFNRMTEFAYPDGDRLVFEYGERGRVDRIAGAGPVGRPVIANVDYTPSAQLDRLEYGNGVASLYAYDERLRLDALRTMGAGQSVGTDVLHYDYVFDPYSNITEIDDLRPHIAATDPRRNSRRFEYDELHRITRYRLVDAVAPANTQGEVTYSYDAIDNLLTRASDVPGDPAASGGALWTYEYGGTGGRSNRLPRAANDPPGPHALTAVSGGVAPRTFEYDDNGNLVAFDGKTATWDFQDRLIALEDDDFRAAYQYDYSGRRISKRVDWKTAGTGHNAGDVEVTLYPRREFELRNPSQPTKYVFLNGERVAEVTGTFDATAERTQSVALDQGWNLFGTAVEGDADDAARLTGSGLLSFVYDRTTQGYLPLDPANGLPAGSILGIFAPAATARAIKGAYAAPTTLQFFAGDFFSALGLEAVPKSVLPQSADVWLYDTASGRWRFRSGDGPGFDELPSTLGPGQALFARSPTSASSLPPESARIRFQHGDHLRSTSVVTDGAGRVVEETAYLPFGEPRHRARGDDFDLVRPPHLFGAMERDAESGLHAFGARNYDAALARFLSVDPEISQVGATTEPRRLNPYAYALNNPLRLSDTSGRNPVEEIFGTRKLRERIQRQAVETARVIVKSPEVQRLGRRMKLLNNESNADQRYRQAKRELAELKARQARELAASQDRLKEAEIDRNQAIDKRVEIVGGRDPRLPPPPPSVFQQAISRGLLKQTFIAGAVGARDAIQVAKKVTDAATRSLGFSLFRDKEPGAKFTIDEQGNKVFLLDEIVIETKVPSAKGSGQASDLGSSGNVKSGPDFSKAR